MVFADEPENEPPRRMYLPAGRVMVSSSTPDGMQMSQCVPRSVARVTTSKGYTRMPPIPQPTHARRRGSAGLEQLVTPLLVTVFLSMSLSTWFFGTALSQFAAVLEYGAIGLLAQEGSGEHWVFVTAALVLAAVMTVLPALFSIHVGAILERRYSPRVLPRLREFGSFRLVCIWAALFYGTARISLTAHEAGWQVVMAANEHGLQTLLGWEALRSFGLATCALVSAAALTYLKVEFVRRANAPPAPGLS